jgi:predicted 3-demethylubiquinone-9 3-methyltransferase (glyoxalase superfamily)
MSPLATCLWFDQQAEPAARFYVETFRALGREAALGDIAGGPAVTFRLDGQAFMALNGGPHYTFTPAVSLAVTCADQREIDAFWDALSAGGAPGRCGWLTDRFGLSWQVIPGALPTLMRGERGKRVMQALLGMSKLDIAALERA